MQPFGRAVVKALISGRNGTAPPLGKSIGLPWAKETICLPRRLRAPAPVRFYSTPPKKDNDLPSSPFESSTVPPKGGDESHPVSETTGTAEPTSSEATSADQPSNRSHPSHNIKEKFSQIMDNLQSRALTASQTLNDLTGYTDIERIKSENTHLETSLAAAHTRLRAARAAYKSSNAKRAATQREVTTLLARKESWTPTDLERFTELYRTDHVLEGEVAQAQEALTDAEIEEQDLGQKLNAGILKRYHEEQIWSDRIRRASTWGTWGLMGMNFLLFVVLQFVAEPWRRRRLVRGVVEEEKQVLSEVRGELAAVKAALEKKDIEDIIEEQAEAEAHVEATGSYETESPMPIPAATSWKEFLSDPARWKMAAEDLCSERRLDLRMRDISALALEGAAAGAVIAGSIVWALARRT